MLAGLDVSTGITASTDLDAELATGQQCVVYTAMADNRLPEALDDYRRILAAGVNVVGSSAVFFQYPWHVLPPELLKPIEDAAQEGNSSLFVNGIDPGFANDALPLVLTGISERIDEVRVSEILNYNTYNQALVLFDIMGFGRSMDDVPMILLPGVMTMAWGSVVRQIAAGLDIELDSIEEWYERRPAPETFEVDAGTIEKGTAAALHFELRGIRAGKTPIVLEHVTRLRDDLAPDWPQPAGQGCYRVEISGEPNLTLDLQMLGSDGDHNTAGLKATAMRLVNAIPDVVQGTPGLLTALDLVPITGRGLVS